MKRASVNNVMDFSTTGAFVRGESTLAVVCVGTFDDVAARLETSLAKGGLEVVHFHDLDQLLAGSGFGGEFRCRVYEVWSTRLAVQLLELDADVGHLLPHRVTLHDQGGVTTIVTPLPRVLMTEFSHAAEVARISRQLEGVLQPMLRSLC